MDGLACFSLDPRVLVSKSEQLHIYLRMINRACLTIFNIIIIINVIIVIVLCKVATGSLFLPNPVLAPQVIPPLALLRQSWKTKRQKKKTL